MYWYTNKNICCSSSKQFRNSHFQILYHLFGLYEFLPHLDVETWLGHLICRYF